MSSSSPLTPFIQPLGFFCFLGPWEICLPPAFTLADQSGTLFHQIISHVLPAFQMALCQQDLPWVFFNRNTTHAHIPRGFVPFTPFSFFIHISPVDILPVNLLTFLIASFSLNLKKTGTLYFFWSVSGMPHSVWHRRYSKSVEWMNEFKPWSTCFW